MILGSVILYAITKITIYDISVKLLNFSMVQQPILQTCLLGIFILLFVAVLCLINIRNIFTNSLSETVKPIKRTFDVVKVKVIHLSTFGISMEVLMITVMLVYYGVISYYWIPFAILT